LHCPELSLSAARVDIRPLGRPDAQHPQRNAALLSPGTFVIAVFFAAQAIFIYESLLRTLPGGTSMIGPPGLQNYVRFFTQPAYFGVLLDTLLISAELTIVVVCAGFPIALVIARTGSRLLRSFLLFAIVVTFLSGGVTRAYAWLIILGNRGLINSLLHAAGLTDTPIQLVYNRVGVFISLVHFLLPFMVLTLVGPLRNVPRTLEDAARNLGASRWRTFIHVTLRLSLPGMMNAAALTYVVALSSFLFPMLLGGGRVQFMANLIYSQIFTAYDIPFAAAAAFIFLLISVAAVIIFSRLSRMLSYEHSA
jgi:putative spermidine/putrescine transport system permease protein